MAAPINVLFHPSQFPGQILAELRHSLRSRQINPKFHYDTWKQTLKWLELHQACSPARLDPNCALTYHTAFTATARELEGSSVHLIGLGCGGGHKDTELLRLLKGKTTRLGYTPVDVSTGMVLVAHQTASEVVVPSVPVVCDLSSAEDLPLLLAPQSAPDARCLVSFFGMIPNFQPEGVLPKVAALLRPGDLLLLSANLSPGNDYSAGLKCVLPQYDNPLTQEWLLMFLLDLGVEKTAGTVRWAIEPCPAGHDLLRLTASFDFQESQIVLVGGETFEFCAGEQLRLFFSYRYTPERVQHHLAKHGLVVQEQWITDSGEEGVFLCERK